MNISFQDRLHEIRFNIKRFQKIEGKEWGAEGTVIELMKQVGQLAALIMVQEKYYFPDRASVDEKYAVSKEKIADELTDIIAAVVRIADHYKIDLEEGHTKARQIEDEFLRERGL